MSLKLRSDAAWRAVRASEPPRPRSPVVLESAPGAAPLSSDTIGVVIPVNRPDCPSFSACSEEDPPRLLGISLCHVSTRATTTIAKSASSVAYVVVFVRRCRPRFRFSSSPASSLRKRKKYAYLCPGQRYCAFSVRVACLEYSPALNVKTRHLDA